MESLNALIFIDTNILLDFYRFQESDVKLSYLNLIETHMDLMITGDQVHMEYKKNRQKVIMQSWGRYKTPDWSNLSVPAAFADLPEVKQIRKLQEGIISQQQKVNTKFMKFLNSPTAHDDVYKMAQKLFSNPSDYNLTRANKDRFRLRNLARKRFYLGYPPRKAEDTSIGDAINWEWIVDCAKRSGKHVIIVTRDSDYGIIKKGNSFLNDWLKQEFSERVSRRRKVILTQSLSAALQMVKAKVSKKMIAAEQRIIESKATASGVGRAWANAELLSNSFKELKHEDIDAFSKNIKELVEQILKKMEPGKPSSP